MSSSTRVPGRPPLARCAVAVDGVPVSFLDHGNGPPVLFLHGLGDSCEMWLDLATALGPRHRVIAPDLAGHGRSGFPGRRVSIAAEGDVIRRLLLDDLGIDRVSIVGHSLGGGVAVDLACRFPDLVDRLCLVAPAGVVRPLHPALRLSTLPGAAAALWALSRPRARAAAERTWHRVLSRHTGRQGQIPDIGQTLRRFDDPRVRQAFLWTVRSMVEWQCSSADQLGGRAPLGSVPIVLVWGSRDTLVPLAHGISAHRAIPGSRLEIFDGAGHFPMRADPGRFHALVRDFLANGDGEVGNPNGAFTQVSSRRTIGSSMTIG